MIDEAKIVLKLKSFLGNTRKYTSNLMYSFKNDLPNCAYVSYAIPSKSLWHELPTYSYNKVFLTNVGNNEIQLSLNGSTVHMTLQPTEVMILSVPYNNSLYMRGDNIGKLEVTGFKSGLNYLESEDDVLICSETGYQVGTERSVLI